MTPERRQGDRRERGKLAPACPFCGSHESLVTDSRWHLLTNAKRRKRTCTSCGEPFYTEEKAIAVRIEKTRTRYSAPDADTS